VLIEGIQQVAMKRDESFSPSLFTFRSHFATIHRYYYYDFMTARGVRLLLVAARSQGRTKRVCIARWRVGTHLCERFQSLAIDYVR